MQGILQKHGNGHWTNTARHRCNVAGNFFYLVESHITTSR